jgi:hypothetical protein
MKKFALYILAFAAIALLHSCSPYKIDEILISRNDVSLTIEGVPVFVFNDDKCQVAFNTERNEYRAMTDDMTDYFILKANQKLTDVDQQFTADLIYTTSGSANTLENLTFTIEKISKESGLVWVWCKDNAIGAVVKLF